MYKNNKIYLLTLLTYNKENKKEEERAKIWDKKSMRIETIVVGDLDETKC